MSVVGHGSPLAHSPTLTKPFGVMSPLEFDHLHAHYHLLTCFSYDKAKHLAMRQALQMIESAPNQLCSLCAEWQSKCAKDSRRYCQDHLAIKRYMQSGLHKRHGSNHSFYMLHVVAALQDVARFASLVEFLEPATSACPPNRRSPTASCTA